MQKFCPGLGGEGTTFGQDTGPNQLLLEYFLAEMFSAVTSGQLSTGKSSFIGHIEVSRSYGREQLCMALVISAVFVQGDFLVASMPPGSATH